MGKTVQVRLRLMEWARDTHLSSFGLISALVMVHTNHSAVAWLPSCLLFIFIGIT